MLQQFLHRIFALVALVFVSATIALAQSSASPDTATIPAYTRYNWQVAQSTVAAGKKLFVVTLDRPHRRQTCRVKSFTADKLVCSRTIGDAKTYLRQQVAALILPGDDDTGVRWVLGFNIGLGAAIWATVVLAATCPACAVATGIAALLCFGAAGAILIGDDQPRRLVYLAPGQQLSAKLGYVQR
jgi:hypothetical protein